MSESQRILKAQTSTAFFCSPSAEQQRKVQHYMLSPFRPEFEMSCLQNAPAQNFIRSFTNRLGALKNSLSSLSKRFAEPQALAQLSEQRRPAAEETGISSTLYDQYVYRADCAARLPVSIRVFEIEDVQNSESESQKQPQHKPSLAPNSLQKKSKKIKKQKIEAPSFARGGGVESSRQEQRFYKCEIDDYNSSSNNNDSSSQVATENNVQSIPLQEQIVISRDIKRQNKNTLTTLPEVQELPIKKSNNNKKKKSEHHSLGRAKEQEQYQRLLTLYRNAFHKMMQNRRHSTLQSLLTSVQQKKAVRAHEKRLTQQATAMSQLLEPAYSSSESAQAEFSLQKQEPSKKDAKQHKKRPCGQPRKMSGKVFDQLGEAIFKCQCCGKEFARSQQLGGHMSRAHSRPLYQGDENISLRQKGFQSLQKTANTSSESYEGSSESSEGSSESSENRPTAHSYFNNCK